MDLQDEILGDSNISTLSRDVSQGSSLLAEQSFNSLSPMTAVDSTPRIPTSDESSPPQYIIDSHSNTKSHKTSPVWQYFSHFHPAHHPGMKHSRICLVCRVAGVDKAVAVGKSSSTGPLVSHLKTHKVEYASYLEAMIKVKEASEPGKSQAPINSFFASSTSIKDEFKRKFARFLVEDSLPLSLCRSEWLKDMMNTANKSLEVPSYQKMKSYLDTLHLNSIKKMKSFLSDKYFSVTIDHWTSLATDNYGALTLHLIDKFKLCAFVLSCMKHEDGCTAVAMEQQMLNDLNRWGLSQSHFVCCITDSASNMNKLGERIGNWSPNSFLRHYYCADHILQRTAVLAFSGNIPSLDIFDEDTSVAVIKKARSLVTYVHSSVIASDKIKRAQQELNPTCVPLKLLSDCETRWWSTHTLVERIVTLKDALLHVFNAEFRFRERQDKLTQLEKLSLTEANFNQLSDILHLLSPFKEAQKALEGDQYVNFSLLPLIIHQLNVRLLECQGSADPAVQGHLFDLITKMVDDFHSRWGPTLRYISSTVRGRGNRQVGIPTYSYWAMALDPRTKRKLVKLLSEADVKQLWEDIGKVILSIATDNLAVNVDGGTVDPPVDITVDAVLRGRPRSNCARQASSFLVYSSDEDEDDVVNCVTIEARIEEELTCYRSCKGIPLLSPDGGYSCPLEWWSNHHQSFPHLWELAKRVLSIPATSAPSERVFSVASHVVNKKRVRLEPETVDLLIYLRGNRDFVDWDAPGF